MYDDDAAIATSEALLAECIERARRDGLKIVYGAFDVDIESDDADEGSVRGVCALGAYNLYAGGRDLGLPAGDELSFAWDAIEHGFDGEPYWRLEDENLPVAWFELGARLRERFQPERAP